MDPADASTGYHLGAQLLDFLAPRRDGQETLTVTVPVATDCTERTVQDGVYDRDIIARQSHIALEILRAADPCKIVTLGGECSVSVVPFTYLAEKYAGDVAMVWIDAHPDITLPGDAYPGYHAMHPAFFVARNRIVAGLADAVVIVESREKGGALITAGIAESYHRDVFALPGDIHRESSAGCNHLIRRNRAALITSADDLVEAMCWQAPRREAVQRSLFPDLTDEEQPIVDYLKARGEGQINRMTVELNRPLSQLLSVLVELEFKGVVKALPGGVYKL